MKILRNILFIIAGLGLLTAYAAPPSPKMVTVPFKADFLGEYIYIGSHADCGSPWVNQVVVAFQGTGTHLGKFEGFSEFCVTGIGEYGNGVSCLVAANGDMLFFDVTGQVLPREPEDPPYVINYWRDEFFIIGGTGRFEGATGRGWTDDYNSTEDSYSHHQWVGSITLVVGKR